METATLIVPPASVLSVLEIHCRNRDILQDGVLRLITGIQPGGEELSRNKKEK